MADEKKIALVTGQDGTPIGVVDVDLITSEGTNLAFRMAAVSNNPTLMDQLLQQTLDRVGTENFGFVATNAVRVLAEQILSPAFEVALKTTGHDFWLAMSRIAAGEEPEG